MAAYNFQKQFVGAVETWQKRHTIRRIGKRTHSKPGDRIQLYTGMRTRHCRKIINPDPTCLIRQPIIIEVSETRIDSIELGGKYIEKLDEFAKSDGFDDLAAMHEFWINFNGFGSFDGFLVGWGPRTSSHRKAIDKSGPQMYPLDLVLEAV